MLRRLGWEIYSTYYLPDMTLLIIAAGSVILVAIGIFGRDRVQDKGSQ